MSVEDAATEFTFRQLEVFGSFSLVLLSIITFSGLSIWWLIRTCSQRSIIYQRVIDAKELDIKHWQNQAFEELKANAAAQLESLKQVTAAINMVERLVK